MKKRTQEEYLEAPHQCPACGSEYIRSLERPEIEGNYVYQDIYCTKCDFTWTDEYKLIGYVESEL